MDSSRFAALPAVVPPKWSYVIYCATRVIEPCHFVGGDGKIIPFGRNGIRCLAWAGSDVVQA